MGTESTYSMNGMQASAIQPLRVAIGGEPPKLSVFVLAQ